MIDFVKIIAWPASAVILGFVFLLMFRTPIGKWISGVKRIQGPRGWGASSGDTAENQEKGNPEPPTSDVKHYLQNFQSPLLNEFTDDITRSLTAEYPDATAREMCAIRFLANTLISLSFERVYRTIFGSQLAALRAMASTPSGIQSLQDIFRFYSEAQRAVPEFYKNYAYEDWLRYLEDNVLAKRMNDHHIGITVRGKEFLKYLVDQNYSDQKFA